MVLLHSRRLLYHTIDLWGCIFAVGSGMRDEGLVILFLNFLIMCILSDILYLMYRKLLIENIFVSTVAVSPPFLTIYYSNRKHTQLHLPIDSSLLYYICFCPAFVFIRIQLLSGTAVQNKTSVWGTVWRSKEENV